MSVDDDDVLLAQELAYVPWSKEERARRTRGRWFAPKEHVPPGFHVLQLLRLMGIVLVGALIMPPAIHLTEGVPTNGMIHPSICTWSIGILVSFALGQMLGTQGWKLAGPRVRTGARSSAKVVAAALPWVIVGAVVLLVVTWLVLRARHH